MGSRSVEPEGSELPAGRPDFYRGEGFSHLTGPDASRVHEVTASRRAVRDRTPLKGNLFSPVVTAEFPGAPAGLPVNWLLFPDRGFDYCLIRMQPGAEWPLHVHGYGEEVYVVISGAGNVTLEDTEYHAEQWDVFHIPAGTRHSMRNSEPNSELCILAINTPPVDHELRSAYWAVPVGFA